MDENKIIQEIVACNYCNDKVEFAGITHFRYNECPKDKLVVTAGKNIVHKDLYKAFSTMQAAAKKDGINIAILSGYRSCAQQKIIFAKKFKDKENPTEAEFIERLRVSAPCGFSEHHTGFTVDINSLLQTFANTKEYQWLKNNADKYGFENSFPLNNRQGLNFEPWHWRYVGTDEAKAIFARARNMRLKTD